MMSMNAMNPSAKEFKGSSLAAQNLEQSPLITKKLPLDKEGYVLSFDINNFDPQAVGEFYHQYGFVIFNEILNKEQIQKSIDDLWVDLNEYSQGCIQRNDPATWKFVGALNHYGFINRKPVVRPQLCKNRSHPKVYEAFKSLYEITSNQKLTEPLLALFDRGSVLRPSKENPQWKTHPIYHFDIHPWWWTKVIEPTEKQWRVYNQYQDSQFSSWLGQGNYIPKVRNFTKFQGVLGLTSTNPQSGGFECVCGFQNYIHEWCKKNKQHTSIEQCPQLLHNMQRVYHRAGSIIIFSRELPHNIYPNVSQKFRYAQYMRMAPESSLMLTAEEKKLRRIQLKQLIHQEENLNDPIARQVYMLDEQEQKSMLTKIKEMIW